MDNYNDKELARGLKTGNIQSFEVLYLRYHGTLYLNIFKIVKEADATKDLLQDVFATLWENRHAIDENKPLSSWLFTVSYNKSVNYLKKVLRESARHTSFQERIIVDDEPDPQVRESRLNGIETAVKHLSPQKSRVFDLCKIQGKTYEQTALELNLSKHTVKEYLSEAVINVKDYLRKHPSSFTIFIVSSLF